MSSAAYEGKTPLEIFRLIAPEFAAVTDSVVSAYIDLASNFVCSGKYGESINLAIALMAAHIMASPGGYSNDGSTSAGRITSRKEGDLQITYGSVSDSSDYLSGTTYGNLLKALLRKKGGGMALMTRGPVMGCSCR